MRNNRSEHPNILKKVIIGITHLLFLIGILLLLFFADASPKPIGLSSVQLIEVVLVFSMGCGLVLLTWLIYIDQKKIINVASQDVPSLINRTLFGSFPYLFNLKPMRGANLGQPHMDKLAAVSGKEFSQVFCAYFDSRLIGIYVAIALLLPILFMDQTPPSYLSFVSWVVPAYVIFTAFLLVTWLSILILIIFRIFCGFKSRN